jgi:hypothetical protein
MSDDGLARLRALADAANIVGDRETAMRLHGVIGSIEAVLVMLDLLSAKLDALGPIFANAAAEWEPRLDA